MTLIPATETIPSAVVPPVPELSAVRAGDERAFRQLFDSLYGPLRRFAFSVVEDVATAEDLVQEAFVRLWDRRATLADDTLLAAYLYRTVRNLGLNHRRDGANRRRLLAENFTLEGAETAPAPPEPDVLDDPDEPAARLKACVADLPPRQREALHLARFAGLSHRDVAEAMGCSPRTVNNHLVAALSTLRRCLSVVGSAPVAFAWWLS